MNKTHNSDEMRKFQREVFDFLYQRHLDEKAAGREFYFGRLVGFKNLKSIKDGFLFRSVAEDTIELLFWEKKYNHEEIDVSVLLKLNGELNCTAFSNMDWQVDDSLGFTKEELLDDERQSPYHIISKQINEGNFIKSLKLFIDRYMTSFPGSPISSELFNRQEQFYKIIANQTKILLSTLHIENKTITIDKGESIEKHITYITGGNALGKTQTLVYIKSILSEQSDFQILNFFRGKNKKLGFNPFGVNLKKEQLFRIGNAKQEYQLNHIFPNEDVFLNKQEYDNIPQSSFYTASRQLIIDQDILHNNKEGGKNKLRNYEFQFTRWYFKQEVNPIFKTKYQETKKALLKLLPNVTEIEVDENDKVWYTEVDSEGKELPKVGLQELSTGMKGIIGLIGDLILHLWEEEPWVERIEDFFGIVLIDEIELHLHPKWQKKFPQILTSVFPNVQFIVTTHSPIPLLGAPKDAVVLNVKRTAEEGITIERLDEDIDIKNMQPNALLTSEIFGFKDIISDDADADDLQTFSESKLYQMQKELREAINTLQEPKSGYQSQGYEEDQ